MTNEVLIISALAVVSLTNEQGASSQGGGDPTLDNFLSTMPGWLNYSIAMSVFGFILVVIVTRSSGRKWLNELWCAVDLKWIAWEAGVPLFTPVLMAAVFYAFAATGPHPTRLSPRAFFAETTPWTLIFFSLTLCAHSLRRLWSVLQNYRVQLMAIIGITLLVAIYAAFLIQWREEGWTPAGKSYSVSIILTSISIVLCSLTSKIPHHMESRHDETLPLDPPG